MSPLTLLPAPAMILVLAVFMLEKLMPTISSRPWMGLTFLVPILALLAVFAAVFDLIRIALDATWSTHILRLVLHGLGLVVGAMVIWQTVYFLVRGIDRLF
jgi:hypothetical protein